MGPFEPKDPLFFLTKLSNSQLQAMIAIAPQSTRKDLPITLCKEELVSDVLRLRDVELKEVLGRSTDHAKQLNILLNTTFGDIFKLFGDKTYRLKSL